MGRTGSIPCLDDPFGRTIAGLLRRRPVTVGEIKLIGKESNRLEERSAGMLTVDQLKERLTTYEDNDRWRRFVLPKLQELGATEVAKAVGVSERRARETC